MNSNEEKNNLFSNYDINELAKALQHDFSLSSILDLKKHSFDPNFSNEELVKYILDQLNKEIIDHNYSIKGNDDTWIEISIDDPILMDISGGEGVVNTNVSTNLNVSVTLNAGVLAVLVIFLVVIVAMAQNGGFCCFPRRTSVRKVDGTKVPIDKISIGEKLAAFDGGENTVLEKITCTVNPGDKMYKINNQVECTWEQLFLTTDGSWLAVDLKGYQLYRELKRITNSEFGLKDNQVRQMVIGDKIYYLNQVTEVSEITIREVTERETLHSFIMDGNKTYYANDYVVESEVDRQLILNSPNAILS